MLSEQDVPKKEDMPSSAQMLIPAFKYQVFEPYTLSIGSVERQREIAEEIVDWWPGWVRYCLASCENVIKLADQGQYERGVPFPIEAWKAQRDVFQKAIDEGRYAE